MILLQKFCIIGFDLIKCGDRVVSQHAIFRHQSGAQSIRILVKQAVVTYAKADNYVELGFFGVQKFCLKDRIAHIHTDIFAGGGAILRPENVDALRQNGTLVHITRSIDKLPTRGRPLSQNIETLKKMEAQRMPLYKSAADITFRNNYTCSRKKLRQRVTTYILEKL
jgi:hypothetical protein